MSLILLAAAASLSVQAAGTAVWLDAVPDPTLTPDLLATTPERVAPDAGWTAEDERAVAHLAQELDAVRPLKDELDGEIQIMRRLDAALATVRLVRAQDRDLVFRALALQGYAVRRYYQDTLASDPTAEAWRVRVGQAWEVRPWVDAIALDPDRLPSAETLPDAPEQVAYQELRARQLLLPPGSVRGVHLPAGARLRVDGNDAPADQAQVTAGRHDLAIVLDGAVLAHRRVDVAAGETATLPYRETAAGLAALAPRFSEGPGSVLLPQPVIARLADLEAPVELVVSGRKAPLRYRLVGDSAVRTAQPGAPASTERRGVSTALVLDAAVGGGWVYDGNFLIENAADGAASTVGTVNAGAPVATLGVSGQLGAFAVGVGADVAMPLGAHHDLPVDDGRMRLRAYPHVAVGHRLLRASAGLMLPWHLGVGPRLHLPLPDLRAGPLELVAAYTHGLPLTRDNPVDGSDWTPADARMAWVGIGGQLRLGD